MSAAHTGNSTPLWVYADWSCVQIPCNQCAWLLIISGNHPRLLAILVWPQYTLTRGLSFCPVPIAHCECYKGNDWLGISFESATSSTHDSHWIGLYGHMRATLADTTHAYSFTWPSVISFCLNQIWWGCYNNKQAHPLHLPVCGHGWGLVSSTSSFTSAFTSARPSQCRSGCERADSRD